MATINVTANVDYSDNWYGDLFQLGDTGSVTLRNATTLRYTTAAGHVITLSGTGFTYNGFGGQPSDGTVTAMSISKGGLTWVSATGLAVDYPDLYLAAFGYTRRDGSFEPGDSYYTWVLLQSADDTINGSAADDQLMPGINVGDDTVNGFGGDDYIYASQGSNAMHGGDGNDTLSYTDSFGSGSATRGITLNVELGTVASPWGGIDTITGFEIYEGSRLADVFTGSAADETFLGLRGRDTYDGNGGFDWLDYSQDITYGGGKGIVINFRTGGVFDGFGTRDAFTDIDGVVGTAAGDQFVGHSGSETFYGGAGTDTYNGKDGYDLLTFWRNSQFGGDVGVDVDLERFGHEVLNDGFGHVEQAENMEDIDGAQLADVLRGNSFENWLTGYGGVDTLEGRGGADRFFFNGLDDSGVGIGKRDVIIDFNKLQGDKISLEYFGDANFVVDGEQRLAYVGGAAFSGAGQVRWTAVNEAGTVNDRTVIQISTDNDAAAEFEIQLTGLIAIRAADILL
ncbi:MAG: hypothetical protein JWR75_101 [Devosia sp.]|nr:hypothetical protein [Devosia sp.]